MPLRTASITRAVLEPGVGDKPEPFSLARAFPPAPRLSGALDRKTGGNRLGIGTHCFHIDTVSGLLTLGTFS